MQSFSYNGEVNRYFGANDDDTDRDEAKKLCLIQATDSWQTANIRMTTFYHRVLKTHLRTNSYRTPANDNGDITYRPQVTLYFQQDAQAVVPGASPLEAEISFRIMDQTSESLTEAYLEKLARDISLTIGGNTPYKFTKGKVFAYYLDKVRGYDFRVLVANKDEGEEVIKKILSIRNHTFDADLYRFVTPQRSNTTAPKTDTILKKVRKRNRWRPPGIVEFSWAEMYVHGLNPSEQPILVDCTGTKRNPIQYR